MEEKILIKSQRCNITKIFIIFVIIGAVISLLLYLNLFSDRMEGRKYYAETYERHKNNANCGYRYGKCDDCRRYKNFLGNTIEFTLDEGTERCYFIPFAIMTVSGALLYFALRHSELTVTDKRIYGMVAWGKRVDLPVDSVSAISATHLWKGVSVATSSGGISFKLIKNADEIYNILNNLLIERQQIRAKVTAPVVPQKDEADQLEKYKKLLDDGVISQEEFDAKKKQILGL